MIALFDFDGTIAETGPTVSECLALSIEKTLGRRPDAAALGRAMGSGAVLAGLFEQLVGTVSAGTMATLVDDYLAFYPDVDKRLTQLYDGVGEALDALRAAGIGLAIVTNKQTLPTKQSLAHFRLEEYFPLVIGAEAGLAGKTAGSLVPPAYRGRIITAFAPQDFGHDRRYRHRYPLCQGQRPGVDLGQLRPRRRCTLCWAPAGCDGSRHEVSGTAGPHDAGPR